MALKPSRVKANYMARKHSVQGNQTTWRAIPSPGKSNYMALKPSRVEANYMARKHSVQGNQTTWRSIPSQGNQTTWRANTTKGIKLHGAQTPIPGKSNYMALNTQHKGIKLRLTPSLHMGGGWRESADLIGNLIEINKG